MSLQTDIMSPVTTPSMIYPQLGSVRPRGKHYTCTKCLGNIRSRIQVEIYRKTEIVYGFACDDCNKRWYVSTKLILNEVLEEHFQKIHNFTMKTEKEFGALLVKTPEGIRMDMIEVGENTSVDIKKGCKYRKNEKIIGSVHAHPYSDEFSCYDIATFLRDDWEKISVVVGSKGTICVMVKTESTISIKHEEITAWIDKNRGISLIEKAEKNKFLLFIGKVNNLRLVAGASNFAVTSLESLLKYVKK